jgi:hypothetical protein
MSIQVITVTGNISLTTSNSGNVYQLNVPSANSTISLPPPTNGFNATFIGNNNSSYTYSFSTPSGVIIQSTTTGINSPITISNVNPSVTVSGNIGKEYHVNSDGTNYTIFEINLNATGITPGTYGSSTQVAQITFDTTGRAVQVSNVPISILSSSSSGNRVDLTNVITDFNLQVGQEAYIAFNNATSVPLHIATSSGSYYEMHLIPTNSWGMSGATSNLIYLNPNNTTYSNVFVDATLYRNASTSSSGYSTISAFRIGYAFSSIVAYIINLTQYKNIKGFYDIYGTSVDGPTAIIFSDDWHDTTTAWTSLGTITFPQSSSGYILVRRLQ